MPREKKPAKQASGGARLKASGKSAMLLGWSAEEKKKIEDAAKIERRPMSQFVMYYSLMAAERILEKSSN